MTLAARPVSHIHQPRQKYSARRTEVDGITFASKMEAAYYSELCRLRDAGDVRSFVLQPAFVLQPTFRKNGTLYRAITYVADFGVVWKDGRKTVVDVKGMKTPVFALKQKLYARLYDEPLVLVTKVKGGWKEWV